MSESKVYQLKVRLPEDVRNYLATRAKKNNRSMNAELITALVEMKELESKIPILEAKSYMRGKALRESLKAKEELDAKMEHLESLAKQLDAKMDKLDALKSQLEQVYKYNEDGEAA